MNQFLGKSIELANEANYLDQLNDIYSIVENSRRPLEKADVLTIERCYNAHNDAELISTLITILGDHAFPIKDSYMAFLKKDRNAILRNPLNTHRIAQRLYSIPLQKLIEACEVPIESNRQMGPKFKVWLRQADLGIPAVSMDEFCFNNDDAILDAPDDSLKDFAERRLGYRETKGLDFMARVNNKYILGEAKFITDEGGHQMAQYIEARDLLDVSRVDATPIAILDGVLYIKPKAGRRPAGIYKDVACGVYQNKPIMSALLLKEYLDWFKRTM